MFDLILFIYFVMIDCFVFVMGIIC